MSKIKQPQFSAAPSMCGYLFQCRYALLESLRRLRKMEEFTVSLETLDDVLFERDSNIKELLQIKHHIKKTANLTDASSDIWKTLRIWCEHFISGEIQQDSIMFLITTAVAQDGSAAAYLNKREIPQAIERLNTTAESSVNKDNQRAYEAYRSLDVNQKTMLLNSVYIIDASPSITDIDILLQQETRFAVERQYLPSFLQRLEGWWFRRAIKHLANEDDKKILSEEIDAELSNLREQFKQDNLPIDEDILNATVDATGYQDNIFVKQLEMIGIGNRRILFAIKDYYRAFTQRSRWIREDLLFVGELDRYENRLTEEWERYFERMREELGEETAEEERKKAAQALYKWIESDASFPIRPSCQEPFITRGSYQILSDDGHVGWHPEFKERLQQLLEVKEATE